VRPRIRSVPVNLKSVKKVEVKKTFRREETVFADYQADDEALFKRCFEYDMKYSKIGRFVKDLKEVNPSFALTLVA
jgi:hypothetical protein